MPERPLNNAEAALWRRVVETVRPAPGRTAPPPVVAKPAAPPKPAARAVVQPIRPIAAIAVAPRRTGSDQTLDAGWDRQLARGRVSPDRIVDLHGDTLDRAYGRIDAALAGALAAGERVMLLVTGKPGGERGDNPGRRGAIRAVVGDWLAASRHAAGIAAVRPAHPRHGGAGALYVILRRAR